MSKIEVCEVDPEVISLLKKFRFRKEKNSAAIILKIDPKELKVVLDEEYQDVTIEDVARELPEAFPRYVIYTLPHSHGDGRVSYPLLFIFVSPSGTKPDLQMMYSGTKTSLVKHIEVTKVFEIRNTDELNDAWLQEKLAYFK
eukprot:Opistho-1_new@90641